MLSFDHFGPMTSVLCLLSDQVLSLCLGKTRIVRVTSDIYITIQNVFGKLIFMLLAKKKQTVCALAPSYCTALFSCNG